MSLCYDLIDYVTSNAWTSEARNNITQCVKQYSHKNNFTSAPAGLLGQTTSLGHCFHHPGNQLTLLRHMAFSHAS